MLALAEAVGEQTAPLGEVLDAAVARRGRARGRAPARRRLPRLLGRPPGGAAHPEPGRAGGRPALPRRPQRVAAADHRGPVAQGRGERRVRGVAPYAAAAALVAMMERMAAFHVDLEPYGASRDRRRRDDRPDHLPDRDRLARRRTSAQPLGCAVSSSSRSKTFSNSSRLRRAPQSSSSGSPSVCSRSSTSDGLTRAVIVLDDLLAAAVEAVGDPEERGEPAHPVALLGVELADQVVGRLRLAAPVPADERGEHEDLLGVEAAQLAVGDEVRGVTVVTVVRDVLADVVQQRGVLEQLPVVVVEAVELAGLVEQLEAQLGDLAGVGLGPRRTGAPAPAPTRGGSRAGRRTSRPGRGGRSRRGPCLRAAPTR